MRFRCLLLFMIGIAVCTSAYSVEPQPEGDLAIDEKLKAQIKAEVKAELIDELLVELEDRHSTVSAAPAPAKRSRLSIGGYGEVAFSRNFFSDNYLRYSKPELYKNDQHGRFDIPHVVIFLGYDFGRGWSMGSEIEFEHGGTESAVEIEAEEGGEYESEIERGGEVALEQFWLQKSFSRAFNIRIGHMVVPVGATNANHLPTQFFGVYRPEGENTILPCTWHETGVSLWGEAGKWRYEVMFLPGLDSDRFSSQGWIHDGAGSPYEFKIATAYAGAFRVDNYSVPGLRLSLSGYVGNSFRNTLAATSNSRYDNVRGTVLIGAFDFAYDAHNWIVRGNFDYGHLTDSDVITSFNMGLTSSSVSPKQKVGSDAVSAGAEFGYDIFSQVGRLHSMGQRFYLFGRYEYYDSMFKATERVGRIGYCGRQRFAVGLNYFPVKGLVIKAEYSMGILKSPYNNEPAVSLGIAYSGFFN